MNLTFGQEYDRFLWFVARTSRLCAGANKARGLKTTPAHPQVSVEGWTKCLIVNRRAGGGLTLGINLSVSIYIYMWNYFMSGRPRRLTNQTLPTSLSPRTARQPGPDASKQPDQFRSLNASLLYCPSCRVATPTRERLLLVLPSGNLYEYLCQYCGTSTGSKTDSI